MVFTALSFRLRTQGMRLTIGLAAAACPHLAHRLDASSSASADGCLVLQGSLLSVAHSGAVDDCPAFERG